MFALVGRGGFAERVLRKHAAAAAAGAAGAAALAGAAAATEAAAAVALGCHSSPGEHPRKQILTGGFACHFLYKLWEFGPACDVGGGGGERDLPPPITAFSAKKLFAGTLGGLQAFCVYLAVTNQTILEV